MIYEGTLKLPYEIEFVNPLGQTLKKPKGYEVKYRRMPTRGQDFRLRLAFTVYAVNLVFDSEQECKDAGFEI